MLFSDDVRPNTYVTQTQADAICKMAVDRAADPDGVVCQNITEHIADKYNLGSSPKIAYGYVQSSQYSADITFSDAGFTTPPIVVFAPRLTIYDPQHCNPVPCWVANITTTTATVYCGNSPWFEGVYWMAIGN